MNQQSLINALEAWGQEELAGQRRILGHIQRQEEALVANRSGELLAACQDLDRELRTQMERHARRSKLFAQFAALYRADERALSMSSILERAGNPPRLSQLRDDLRRSSATLVRRNRRFAALAGAQRKLIEEIVAELLNQQDPKALGEGGQLVNAEA